MPLPERWDCSEGTQAALHDKDHPVFKLLNVTARNTGPVLISAMAGQSGARVRDGEGRMTEINRSSLLAKLKHIKGMKLLAEQAVLLYLLMADEQTPVWVKTIVVSALAYLLCPVDAVPDFIPGVAHR